MTDEPDRPNPTPGPPASGSPPQTPAPEPEPGLVEGVREELEQVVENVREEVGGIHDRLEGGIEKRLPRPVRWTAGKIATLILLSLAGLIVTALVSVVLYFKQHSVWAAGELSRLLNQALAQQSNVVLTVHDIRGNPLQRVVLIHPVVRIRGANAPPLVEASSMTVEYAPWNLWMARKRSIEVQLDHPVFRLARDARGKLILPEWRGGQPGRSGTREIEVLLSVRGASVSVPDTEYDVRDWSFDARAETGPRTIVALQRMTWDRGPFGSRLDALSGEVTSGDSVRIRVGELRTPDLALAGNASWRSGSPLRTVHLDVHRVRWAWLAKVFDNGVFDVPGEGRGSVDAVGGKSWMGRLNATADWDSLPMSGDGGFTWANGRLQVEPLHLRSRAGNLSGSFSYGENDWELAGDVHDADPAYWRAINLSGWPAGQVNGHMLFTDQRKGSRSATRLVATLFPTQLAGWRADSGDVVVESPIAGPDTFAVHMSRRGGRATLLGQLEKKGWTGRWEASQFPLDEWPDGRASGIHGIATQGRGTVVSRNDTLYVTGNLAGTKMDWIGIQAAGWSLADVSGALLPKPNFTSRAALGNAFFLGVHFDSAASAVHVGDQTLALEALRARSGDTLTSVAGRVDWDARGWSTTLDRAEATSDQFHWVADPPLLLTGDPHGVQFRRFEAHDSTATLSCTGHWAAPGGAYAWDGTATHLDLGHLGLPLEWGLAGNANVKLHVDGPSGDPHWTLEAQATGPGYLRHRLDGGELSLSGRRNELQVEKLSAHLSGGTLEGRGRFSRTARAWPDTLTGDAISRWLASSGSWEGELAANDMPIDRVDRFVPEAAGWAGRVSGTLAVAGAPARPEYRLHATATPLVWDSLRVDHAEVTASYKDERLDVAEVLLTRANVTSRITGQMPLRLSADRPPAVPDGPMQWHVDLDHGDLALLPLFVPQVAQARGALELHADVRGTAKKPLLQGQGRVRGGALVPAGREEILEDVNASFRLGESTITLDSLSARQGKRGRVTGHGVLQLAGSAVKDYRFVFTVRDFTSGQTGLYAALFTSDSLVVTPGPKVAGQTLPHVEGNIDLERAAILFDFANQTENDRISQTIQPLYWTYRIHVKAINNLRWQPPDGDIEFNADLVLDQTPTELIIYGDMSALRGRYDFLSNVFDVNKCDLTFDNVGGLNPTIDAEATTRVIPIQTAAETDLTAHTVTVDITGRANQPAITFATDPPDWDEARVLREITVGRFSAGKGFAGHDPLDNYLTRAINDQLSPIMGRTFTEYVNQWRLEREQGGLIYGQGNVLLTVRAPINRQLSLSSSWRVPGVPENAPQGPVPTSLNLGLERNVAAEYRLNRFFLISTELAQRRPYSGSSPTTGTGTTDFNVNLKARWEY